MKSRPDKLVKQIRSGAKKFPAHRIDQGSSAVPVGILWWNGPTRRLTIIAKMTLIPKNGALVLADSQEPLRTAVPSSLGVAEELHYPGDFVPFKPRCDVLLVGSAYASVESTIIPVHFRVGALERRVYALAGQPSTSIPLSARYLRREPTSSAEEAPVGPLSPQHPHRARLTDSRIPSRAAAFERVNLPRDFDGRCFHAAPHEQQMDPITPGIALLAPWRSTEGQKFWLPPLRPRIFLFEQHSESGLREVPLSCDTLWIDTAQARCVLTYRAVIDAAPNQPFPTSLVAVFASVYDAVLAGAAQMICAQAKVRRATEPQDVEGFVEDNLAAPQSSRTPAAVRSAPPADEAGTKVYSTTFTSPATPFVSANRPTTDDGPTTPSPSPDDPDDEPRTRIHSGLVAKPAKPVLPARTRILASLPAQASALPFVPTHDEPVDEPSTRILANSGAPPRASVLPFVSTNDAPDEPGTRIVRGAAARAPVLPFSGITQAPTSPPAATGAPQNTSATPFVSAPPPAAAPPSPPERRASKTFVPEVMDIRPALPFVSAEPDRRPSTPPPALPFVSAEPDRRPSNLPPALPFVSTDHDRPPSIPPAALPFPSSEPIAAPTTTAPATAPALESVESVRISLETFAEIKVDLWAGIGLREALAKHGIDQRAYYLFERRHADELGEEVRQGTLDRTRALRAALRRARERRESISTEDAPL